MSMTHVTGLETEYGITLEGASDPQPFRACQVLLAECDEAPDSLHLHSPEDFMLVNGSRFYIDHAHPEYSTPEVRAPLDAVAADKAGELIVDRCRVRANRRGSLGAGEVLRIYKDNSDGKGNSYGCHENYSVSVAAFENIFDGEHGRPGELAIAGLLPFLVTRSIIIGAGKVGSENGTPPTGFQLSQRADFMETLMGLQTTYRRPLLNTRDEPHADPTRTRRLHVITGDANLAEYSTYLKVASAYVVVRMLEDGCVPEDVALADPVRAFSTVSRDLTFSAPLHTLRGESKTALAIQRSYVERAAHYLKGRAGQEPLHRAVQVWSDTLDALSNDWRGLCTRFDWAIKRRLLERYLARHEASWDLVRAWQPVVEQVAMAHDHIDGATMDHADVPAIVRVTSPQRAEAIADHMARHRLNWSEYPQQRQIYYALRKIGLDYHELRRGQYDDEPGLFFRLEKAGLIERLVDDSTVEAMVDNPPVDTRAAVRAQYLRQWHLHLRGAEWTELIVDDPKSGSQQRIHFSDVDLVVPDVPHTNPSDLPESNESEAS